MYRKGSDIKYTRSSLTDVNLRDTTSKSLQIIDCDWENVSFVDCYLSNVIFHNVKAKNVHFCSVDFRSMRITGLKVIGVVFQDISIEQIVINSAMLTHVSGKLAMLKLLVTNNADCLLTRARHIHAGASADKGLTDHNLQVRVRAQVLLTTRRTKDLLDLPSRILDKIMVHLYHKEEVWLYDRPTTCNEKMPDQTNYKTADHSRTTYEAYSGDRTKQGLSVMPERKSLEICVQFIRVNRRCFDMAVKHVYDRRFCFANSVESCLAFLHDHRREPYRVSRLEVTYVPQTNSRYSDPGTLPASWRRLFKGLVHERADLGELTLALHDNFWSSAPWRRGAGVISWTPSVDMVFDRSVPLNDYIRKEDEDGNRFWENGHEPNFLTHVARLSRVGVEIRACGTEDAEKVEFCQALRERIQGKMDDRPRLAEARSGTCKERRLECCCYYYKRR